KAPAGRYATAHELAEDLRRFLGGEPIRARPVGQAERFGRWCRRNPVVAGLLLAVMLSLVAGTILASVLAIRANAYAQQALTEKRQADAARAQADKERQHAEVQRERAERFGYYPQIALAQREWQDNEVEHARDLLDGCRSDLRGWEHAYLQRLFYSNQR